MKPETKDSFVNRHIGSIIVGVVVALIGVIGGGVFYAIKLGGQLSTFEDRAKEGRMELIELQQSTRDSILNASSGFSGYGYPLDGIDEGRSLDGEFAVDVAIELRPILEELAGYDKMTISSIRKLEEELINKFAPILSLERERNRRLQIENSRLSELQGQTISVLNEYGENYLRAIKSKSLLGGVGETLKSTATLNWFKNLDQDREAEKLRKIINELEKRHQQIDLERMQY